jgi:phytanoyl-CoA dioxygenase PhyH
MQPLAPDGRSGVASSGPSTAEPASTESLAELLAEIDQLSAGRQTDPDPEIDRRLLSIRHRAGLAMLADGALGADYPVPELDRFGDGVSVPEVGPGAVSPQLLRGAILSRGCLLIRGLVNPGEASEFRLNIDRAFAARDAVKAGDPGADGYFVEFVPDSRYDRRPWLVNNPSMMRVADSPRAAADLFDLLGRAGVLNLATGYLGEHPAISAGDKSTLRRVKPAANYRASRWHQDGAFLGSVRTLNVWLSLSHCGDVAPGLDLIPRRLDYIVPTGTEGAAFDWSVSHAVAEESAGDAGIVRPLFEPGDAVLFDELCLHATGYSPEMTETRYAIECWFFGPSAFPAEYPPLAS